MARIFSYLCTAVNKIVCSVFDIKAFFAFLECPKSRQFQMYHKRKDEKMLANYRELFLFVIQVVENLGHG